MPKSKTPYYAIALFVTAVWSVAYVSVKVLLKTLTPVELMFDRFVVSYLAMVAVYPKFKRPASLKNELMIVGAAVSGGTAYYLMQDFALNYTSATNGCLLISMAPLFTAFAAHFATKNEKLKPALLMGSALAFTGCFLVIFNGQFRLELHLAGDGLALGAALCWAVYSIFMKKVDPSENSFLVTRKIFFYSILTTLPLLPLFGYRLLPALLLRPEVLWNLLFLAILSSCLCIALWSKAIWALGAVKTTNFIYLSPAITLLSSALIIHETVTEWAIGGMALILLGVWAAERGGRFFPGKAAPGQAG